MFGVGDKVGELATVPGQLPGIPPAPHDAICVTGFERGSPKMRPSPRNACVAEQLSKRGILPRVSTSLGKIVNDARRFRILRRTLPNE